MEFNDGLQDILIDEAKTLVGFQRLRLHAVATEPSHVHLLVSWRDERHWKNIRDKVKESLSRRLNRELGREQSLSEGASRRHVEDQDHFNYLMYVYLPSHSGKKWFETDSDS